MNSLEVWVKDNLYRFLVKGGKLGDYNKPKHWSGLGVSQSTYTDLLELVVYYEDGDYMYPSQQFFRADTFEGPKYLSKAICLGLLTQVELQNLGLTSEGHSTDSAKEDIMSWLYVLALTLQPQLYRN